MNKRHQNTIFILQVHRIYFSLFLLIFGIIFFINFLDLKEKLSSSIITATSEKVHTNILLSLMSTEIASLRPSIDEKETPSISRAVFLTITNIWPEDIRTFLGREIPGFSNFNTEIAIAGRGTDLTTLPMESAPPVEVLLKEKERADKELAKTNVSQENPVTPVPKTEKDVAYIYHSHSWEAFLPTLPGKKTADEAVSLNESKNIIAVGKKLRDELMKKGIGASHSTSNVTEELKKKNWNYNDSYTLSRETVKEVMAQESSISYLIDIHRDSQPRKLTTTIINGKPYARLFFIVGKDNKNYEKNLALAKELNKMLEEKFPGISRGVFVKTKDDGNGVYNQDLSSQSMLLEFGGIENNSIELDHSIKAFAEVFSEYYWEAVEVNGN
ncbi:MULTISPECIES: stage II sporulation protein P [unclassified Bacillus (in: firmicutes)]|uniref:stage II sporulation protein P n=1 Tax=unclassified Bacillus (in: firmicutes) TaxID=185979 RepID=UPI001BEA9085|nr:MULTISPECIES: stage II sporulation protein P [unclassified Bacillus (in: firmicutes)]MBT2640207.1 stage II sporulation protein P [Bacillus sp. ISL-39]MBT2662430.1 stage II sporulation protein P [Bacillus sp. ISL-45]